MANSKPWMKGVVFIGLLVSVLGALATGGMLEDKVERNGGNVGATLSSGDSSVGIHVTFAGLILLFLLLHLVVNRKSIIFTLKKMFEKK
jgi:hypothetical protein